MSSDATAAPRFPGSVNGRFQPLLEVGLSSVRKHAKDSDSTVPVLIEAMGPPLQALLESDKPLLILSLPGGRTPSGWDSMEDFIEPVRQLGKLPLDRGRNEVSAMTRTSWILRGHCGQRQNAPMLDLPLWRRYWTRTTGLMRTARNAVRPGLPAGEQRGDRALRHLRAECEHRRARGGKTRPELSILFVGPEYFSAGALRSAAARIAARWKQYSYVIRHPNLTPPLQLIVVADALTPTEARRARSDSSGEDASSGDSLPASGVGQVLSTPGLTRRRIILRDPAAIAARTTGSRNGPPESRSDLPDPAFGTGGFYTNRINADGGPDGLPEFVLAPSGHWRPFMVAAATVQPLQYRFLPNARRPVGLAWMGADLVRAYRRVRRARASKYPVFG